MCAELQEVFGMSINAAPLPFPLKDGAVVSPQPAVVLGSASAGSKALGGRNPDESIELTRAPRDSEVCIFCFLHPGLVVSDSILCSFLNS